MKHLWHKIIVWYLRRCWGAFHCYPYGERGRYVVLMSEAQYHIWQNAPDAELADRLEWWQKRTKSVSALNDRLKAENAWLRQRFQSVRDQIVRGNIEEARYELGLVRCGKPAAEQAHEADKRGS